MPKTYELPIKAALLGFVWLVWWWALDAPLSTPANLAVIVGAVLLVYPAVWLGRRLLDRQPIPERTSWITTYVHYTVGGLFGLAFVRAVTTYRDWSGWTLPIPVEAGLWLVRITGLAATLTVVNLALKGLGLPFAIALTKKLAVDWMYAWTRNPMVLCALAFAVSLGIWYQSALFVLWVLLLVAPALLFFVRVYEERELEVRFGAAYLAYKARTPVLFPKRPAAGKTGLSS